MSICKTPLITEQDLKENTGISLTLNIDLLRPYIIQSQELELKTFICEDLFNELIDQTTNNTLTSDNSDLMELIKPALILSSFYRALLWLGIRIVDSGIVRKDGTNSTSLTDEEVNNRRNQVKSDAHRYWNEMMKFLNDNSIKYPLYEKSDCFCLEVIVDEFGRLIKRPTSDMVDPGIV